MFRGLMSCSRAISRRVALRTSTSTKSGLLFKASRKNASNINVTPLFTTSSPAINSKISKHNYATTSPSSITDSEVIMNRKNHADVLRLIDAYRTFGHLIAHINPLLPIKEKLPSTLDPATYGIKTSDTKKVPLKGLISIPGKTEATIKEIIDHLRASYTSVVGVETSFSSVEEQEWIAEQMEKRYHEKLAGLTAQDRAKILTTLAKPELFNQFMQKKYPTVKRYSGEGNEASILAFAEVIKGAARGGSDDVVLTMAHRGRLELLVSVLKYEPVNIFYKLSKGQSLLGPNVRGLDDVLSHIGQSVDLDVNGKQLHVSLINNPSHLELALPVAMGKSRAKQENNSNSLCVMVHGDSAMSGQGVVAEVTNMAYLADYTVGGSVHLVVNNQLGFTATERETRSARYCTDIAKLIGAPVFHANADRPEEVAAVTEIAVDFRNKFKKDVFVNVIGYRRYGHNEMDEPSFTQPSMYNKIRATPSVVQLYKQSLEKRGVAVNVDAELSEFNEYLNAQFQKIQDYSPEFQHLQGKWAGFKQFSIDDNNVDTWKAEWTPDTGFDVEKLRQIGLTTCGAKTIEVHRLLQRYFQGRKQKLEAGSGIDWPTAEALAVGSLVVEGHDVRLSGQDTGRGTFSHRHWKLWDQTPTEFDGETGVKYEMPLNNLQPKQGRVVSVNSLLSEQAVLGFEYGYSFEAPNALTIWEAQFGDFANGAQMIIDQFIVSAEDKWARQSGVVLLLPHGYDGAGPEHSSARIERYLQAANDDMFRRTPDSRDRSIVPNMSVIYPSTPANYFHALRRQMKRNFRKPLVVIGPKTLLRDPMASSTLEEMGPGTRFQSVFPDTNADSMRVQKVVFCSGKIFYELLNERKKRGVESEVALIRIEELTPFPAEELEQEMFKYRHVMQFVWCQEEPQNMGAWSFIAPRFKNFLNVDLQLVSQPPLGPSAVGNSAAHQYWSKHVISACFDI